MKNSKFSPAKPSDLAGLPPKKVTVIYGPMRCGKTRNSKKLQSHFGCKRTVEDYTIPEIQSGKCLHSELMQMRRRFEDGDLFLTTVDPTSAFMNANILFDVHNFATVVQTVDNLELDGCAPATRAA